MKREAKFTNLFRHWLKTQDLESAAFELKQTINKSLPFNAIKEHQINALQAAQSDNGLLYKAPDDSRGIKPFDLFYLRNAKSYVVIKYPSCFCVIDVNMFCYEAKTSDRNSLTDIRARKIADYVVEL